MVNNLYLVYDLVAEESGPVFEAKNDGCAIRGYADMMRKSSVKKAIEFELYCVGKIDHDTNVIEKDLRKVVFDITEVAE